MRAAACLALALTASAVAQHAGVAPAQAALYSLDEERRVSADRSAVSADVALQELADTAGWSIVFQPDSLRDQMALVSLDLSFDAQGPRTIAHLIAVAGGADVVFDDRTEGGQFSTSVHVVRPPNAQIETGRERLVSWAMQWYQTFLSEDLRFEPVVEENGTEVRMHLASMLMDSGNLEGAIRLFRSVHDDDRTHPYVPAALVKLARCYFLQHDHDKAEEWARKVSRMHPSRPETAEATVLLGRILLAAERYDECVRVMRASFLPLAGAPEIIDIFLITATAHQHRDRPDQVLREMELMASAHNFRELSQEQWLGYHFLRGLGAEGVGKYDEAIEALELFLGTGEDDARRSQAFVLLGRCYMAQDKFLEARAAALEAIEDKAGLDQHWRQQARILEAKTAIALGDKDQAFADLEVEVRKQPEQMPELVLFLIEAFVDVGRFQKAITTAELLSTGDGPWSDKARRGKIKAMFEQARRGGNFAGFPAEAIKVVRHVESEDLQREIAELIGQAYEALGEQDKAADAYRGLLR